MLKRRADSRPSDFKGGGLFLVGNWKSGSAVGITLSEREVATWLGELVAVGPAAADSAWAWTGTVFCSRGVLAWGRVALRAMAFSLSATGSAVGITSSEREVATGLDGPVAVDFAAAGFCLLRDFLAWGRVALKEMALSLSATGVAIGVTRPERRKLTRPIESSPKRGGPGWLHELASVGWPAVGWASGLTPKNKSVRALCSGFEVAAQVALAFSVELAAAGVAGNSDCAQTIRESRFDPSVLW